MALPTEPIVPSLPLLREEPSLRLGCLELFVRLLSDEAPGRQLPDRFVVEEDQRQRVRVHWRSADAESQASWRVSCAFSPWETEVAISETLGQEAVDWLWDGLSASILSMSQAPNAGALLPRGGKKGLLGSCLQDLCRRIRGDDRFCLGLSAWELYKGEAKDLMAICDEDAGHLRFETVRFWTPEQALDLWQAAVVADGQNGRARGHRFVRILLFDATKQSMAALHFAEIANDDPELRADHQALQQLLRSAACGLPPPSGRLAEVLSPLIGGNCKPFLLCTVLERPGPGTEAQDLLDLAEQASLITAQCTRVQGIRQEDFRLAHLEDVLRQLRSHAADPSGGQGCEQKKPEASSLARDGSPGSDRVLYKGSPRDTAWPPAPKREASPKSPAKSSPRSGKSPPVPTVLPAAPTPPAEAKVPDSEAAKAKLAEAELFQEYQELAQAVAAMRAKKKAKAARRQRQLAELKTETADLSQGIESIENSTDSAVLIQALRQELVALKEEVELQQKANSLLTGLQGEDKRRAAQRAALKILQQEATKLQFAKSNMEKGEKRAALVQRCLEEVHARLDSCKIGKQQAEEEISQLKPAYAELGHQLDVAETERRFLQGELDKLRQASGGLRAEILHLQEVRSAVDALPPEELTASKRVAGGSLERLALLQRRLGAAAPQLVPLCTRARAEMEELLKCSQHLEQRQLRLHQVANRAGSDPGASIGASPRRRSDSSQGLSVRQRNTEMARSRSAETVGRSTRASPCRERAHGEPSEARASPRASSRLRCVCGASFMADAQFCQHCGCKRSSEAGVSTSSPRSGIRSTAGTLQDLGLQVGGTSVPVKLAQEKPPGAKKGYSQRPRATPGWT